MRPLPGKCRRRPMVERLRMDERERAPDHRVPGAGEPAGLLGRQLLHVAAQYLDEQSLRHLGQEDRLSRPPRCRLRHQMPYRMLQPFARVIAANADLDHQRQARKEKPVGMPLAAEIAADETCHFAAAAQAHGRQIARQEFAQRGAAVDEVARRPVRDRMRIAMRDNQDIAGFDRDGRLPGTPRRPCPRSPDDSSPASRFRAPAHAPRP